MTRRSLLIQVFAAAAVNPNSSIQSGQLPTAAPSVPSIVAVVFGVIGAFALLNITISGLKYITSAGDPQKASEAKNGIVYSLVGIAVAISAEAIIGFVVGRL